MQSNNIHHFDTFWVKNHFISFRNGVGASALCAYSLNTITESFVGDILEKAGSQSTWQVVPPLNLPTPHPGTVSCPPHRIFRHTIPAWWVAPNRTCCHPIPARWVGPHIGSDSTHPSTVSCPPTGHAATSSWHDELFSTDPAITLSRHCELCLLRICQ